MVECEHAADEAAREPYGPGKRTVRLFETLSLKLNLSQFQTLSLHPEPRLKP